MEEKIFQYLKALRGENSKVSDRSLQEIAKIHTKTITEEGQLNTLDHYKGIFETMQGNIRFNEAEAAKSTETRIRTELEAKNDPPNPPGTPPGNGQGTPQGLTQEQVGKLIQDAVKAATEPLQNELSRFKKQKGQEEIKSEALGKLKTLPLYKNEMAAKLMKNEFERLSGEYNNADAMLEAAKKAYDPLISDFGLKEEPGTPSGGGKPQESQDYKNFVASQGKKKGWSQEQSS